MSSILFVVNDAPYGNEHAYNALRLAGSLAAKEGVNVRVFLMADAVGCAKDHQKVAAHKSQFRLHSMCRVLRVQRSGYYAWKKKPKSKRALADEFLLVKIKQSFESSQSIYGSPRVHCDLREDGVLCGEKRIARLMRKAQLRSVRGYKRPRYRVGMLATTAPNRLQREFTVAQPDQVWVTDITYIRTHEGH